MAELQNDISELQEEINELKEVKEKLEGEDDDRGLYSLETPRTTKVSLPTFSGKDFAKGKGTS